MFVLQFLPFYQKKKSIPVWKGTITVSQFMCTMSTILQGTKCLFILHDTIYDIVLAEIIMTISSVFGHLIHFVKQLLE